MSYSDAVVRVGSGYQAVIPDVSTVLPKPARYDVEKADRVWDPSANKYPNDELNEYVSIARAKYHYSEDQALGMLEWHKYNMDKAKLDMCNFLPFPDFWSVEDKVLFEQAYQFHDKSFHKIRSMLPDKSIASLVKYYYGWKKTRNKNSLMDKMVKRLNQETQEQSEDDDEDDNNNLMDEDVSGEGKTRCANCCATATGQFHKTNEGSLCTTCFRFWKRTGTMKAYAKGDSPKMGGPTLNRGKKKPPKGMHVSKDELIELATRKNGDDVLRSMDQDLEEIKVRVQQYKQRIVENKKKLLVDIDSLFKMPEQLPQKVANRWTKDEELLAVQALRKYGKNYAAVAEILGNKHESHVRTFFTNNERRYQLDKVIDQFNADNKNDVTEVQETSSEPVAKKSRTE